ncbi:MAG: thioredoxin TrxC [Deltaproteobacteria bacterium]|nr:thioredoxin TrxC [Deltaproteobacteria bacterium]
MDQQAVIIRCPDCGAKNRVPQARLGDRPICGKCRHTLPARSFHDRPMEVSDSIFQGEVLSFDGPVLVDCWAPWCGPCRMVAPILDQLASEYAGRVKIAKLNVDENPATASRYGIQSIPTMLLFNRGRQVDRLVGALPKQEIEARLRKVL